jgi:hypothetical protein
VTLQKEATNCWSSAPGDSGGRPNVAVIGFLREQREREREREGTFKKKNKKD